MTEWTPEAQERFFSKLYEEVADPDDQPEDVAQKVASAVGGVSRREMLAGAGILGSGALLGGGGTAALTGDAKAAASTTDGDGDIGTPDNPEDVFADALAVFDGAQNQIGSFDETGIEAPSVNIGGESVAVLSDIPASTATISANATVSLTADAGGVTKDAAGFPTTKVDWSASNPDGSPRDGGKLEAYDVAGNTIFSQSLPEIPANSTDSGTINFDGIGLFAKEVFATNNSGYLTVDATYYSVPTTHSHPL
jgi:hypothetical protein